MFAVINHQGTITAFFRPSRQTVRKGEIDTVDTIRGSVQFDDTFITLVRVLIYAHLLPVVALGYVQTLLAHLETLRFRRVTAGIPIAIAGRNGFFHITSIQLTPGVINRHIDGNGGQDVTIRSRAAPFDQNRP